MVGTWDSCWGNSVGLVWDWLGGDEAGFCPLEAGACDPEDPPACAAVPDGRTADHSRIIAVKNIAYRLGKQVSLGPGALDFDMELRYLASMESAWLLLYGLSRPYALSDTLRQAIAVVHRSRSSQVHRHHSSVTRQCDALTVIRRRSSLDSRPWQSSVDGHLSAIIHRRPATYNKGFASTDG